MERQVLSQALQEKLGDRQVTALVFCTHDLDPEFFEQYVLPVFLGSDFKHNRRIQQVQLDYAIRERTIPIDVFYEHTALSAAGGTACLGWAKHPMHGPRGVFHPKVVLALCEDKAGTESLVVSIASANLTQSGWWRNVECAEAVRIESGETHGYVNGLRQLVGSLVDRRRRWHLADGQAAAVEPIRRFLAGASGYSNSHVKGRLVPQLLPGFDDLRARLRELFGSRLNDAHLEVVSPFFDGSPDAVVARIRAWHDTFRPRSFKIMIPARDGQSTISEEIFDAVETSGVASWAELPTSVVRSGASDESRERATHAKVYRFWRGGSEPLEVLVIGSHNFTGPALGGDRNWETSVVIEPPDRYLRQLLEDATDAPGKFLVWDEDLGADEGADVPYLPVSITFDWQSREATACWYGKGPGPVTLLRAGLEICRVDLTSGERVVLGTAESEALASVLTRSALLVCRREDRDGAEAPLLVEELNFDCKPVLLEGLDLTPAEIFALWSIPGLSERMGRVANARGRAADDEDDIELAELPAVGMSMFERFAGVLQAFSSLRSRIDASMDASDSRRAGLAVYSERFDAPVTALRLMRAQDEADLAHQYVTWCSARLLDEYVVSTYPSLAEEFSDLRGRLLDELGHESVIRRRLVDAEENPEMRNFLDWFDQHFREEVPAP